MNPNPILSICAWKNVGSKLWDTQFDADYAKEQLRYHNSFRAKHGSPPMSLDNHLNVGAQIWAEQLALRGMLQHSTKEEREGNGENLDYSCSTSSGYFRVNATDNWYVSLVQFIAIWSSFPL